MQRESKRERGERDKERKKERERKNLKKERKREKKRRLHAQKSRDSRPKFHTSPDIFLSSSPLAK